MTYAEYRDHHAHHGAACAGDGKVYVVEEWDDLLDAIIDRRCYRTREEAERRGRRLAEVACDGMGHGWRVVELRACWDARGRA